MCFKNKKPCHKFSQRDFFMQSCFSTSSRAHPYHLQSTCCRLHKNTTDNRCSWTLLQLWLLSYISDKKLAILKIWIITYKTLNVTLIGYSTSTEKYVELLCVKHWELLPLLTCQFNCTWSHSIAVICGWFSYFKMTPTGCTVILMQKRCRFPQQLNFPHSYLLL